MTGEIGVGKTTFTRYLINYLQKKHINTMTSEKNLERYQILFNENKYSEIYNDLSHLFENYRLTDLCDLKKMAFFSSF